MLKKAKLLEMKETVQGKNIIVIGTLFIKLNKICHLNKRPTVFIILKSRVKNSLNHWEA